MMCDLVHWKSSINVEKCEFSTHTHTPINADKKNFLNLIEATNVLICSHFLYINEGNII